MDTIELKGHKYDVADETESAIYIKRDGLFFAAVVRTKSGSISVMRDEEDSGVRKVVNVMNLENLFSCLESNHRLIEKIIKSIAI